MWNNYYVYVQSEYSLLLLLGKYLMYELPEQVYVPRINVQGGCLSAMWHLSISINYCDALHLLGWIGHWGKWIESISNNCDIRKHIGI